MVSKIAFAAALVFAASTSIQAQDIPADPVAAVYQLSYPIVNRQGDVMNFVAIASDGQRTYWNNVPQGLTLSPGLVTPPRGTFSRSNIIVRNGWKHSIDVNTGMVAGSVPLSQTQMTAKVPLSGSDIAADPVVAIYQLSYPITNRQGDVMNFVAIASDSQRTYWNHVPQGMTLSPGLVTPPRGTFSRSNIIVRNGWEHSIDANTGMVAGSVPLSQAQTTAKFPIPDTTPAAPAPGDQQNVK